MTIREIVRQGFHYAVSFRSLWLFGFFVGLASGGSNGGGGAGNGTGASVGIGGVSVGGPLWTLSVTEIAAIAAVVFIAVGIFAVLRFIGEGALIEGVVRARQGSTMTMREGFSAGFAHWGVLLRIALLYLAATIGSVALVVAPCVIVLQAFGARGAILLGIPALIIVVPWLVTLYLVQAFAFRIAVLENRKALDAIDKARLFLHGRLLHGLRLIVAAFVGSLGIALLAAVTLLPLMLLLVALIPVLRIFPVIILGCLVVLPLIYVITAMLGTFRSSVWTIGYVTQVES
jgi:hypothetical protein